MSDLTEYRILVESDKDLSGVLRNVLCEKLDESKFVVADSDGKVAVENLKELVEGQND